MRSSLGRTSKSYHSGVGIFLLHTGTDPCSDDRTGVFIHGGSWWSDLVVGLYYRNSSVRAHSKKRSRANLRSKPADGRLTSTLGQVWTNSPTRLPPLDSAVDFPFSLSRATPTKKYPRAKLSGPESNADSQKTDHQPHSTGSQNTA